MGTWIYALGKVNGADSICIGCALCLLCALALSLSFRENRGKNFIRTVIGALTPAIICDILWFFFYFPNGEYRNGGLAASVWLLLYPLSLIIGVCTVTLFHKKDIEGDSSHEKTH